MSFNTIGDAVKAAKSREVSPAFSEVAIFKQLIKERVHPLDLVRELLSNAGAEQVGATKIEIGYTVLPARHGGIRRNINSYRPPRRRANLPYCGVRCNP